MPAKSTVGKSPVSKSSATDVVVLLGSTSIQPAGQHGASVPAGTLHLVDGWDALCGGGRVRFVFPGRVAADGTCPDCVQASRSKPRTATRTATRPAARPATRSATRGRARAS